MSRELDAERVPGLPPYRAEAQRERPGVIEHLILKPNGRVRRGSSDRLQNRAGAHAQTERIAGLVVSAFGRVEVDMIEADDQLVEVLDDFGCDRSDGGERIGDRYPPCVWPAGALIAGMCRPDVPYCGSLLNRGRWTLPIMRGRTHHPIAVSRLPERGSYDGAVAGAAVFRWTVGIALR